MNDKTEEQIFLLMTHAQDLQKAVEQQVQALEKAAQRLERDGVTAFSAAMRENVTRTLGDAKKELTEAVQAAKEASEIAKSGGRRFMRLVSVYAFFVLLLVALGLGAFSWFFVGWKAEEAAALRDRLAPDVPLLCMGHLFTAGGQTVDGDGVRDLYVGSLAHVPASIFPPCIDYLALGHLHVPQRVGGMEHMRYSGSPLPMGFGEASQPKSVCLVDFTGRSARVELLPVPEFQKLERVSGSMCEILGSLATLRDSDSSAWLEVVYTGDDLEGSLRQQVETAVAGSGLRVLKIRNARLLDSQPSLDDTGRNLEELSETEVFSRCLAARKIEGAQADLLMRLYGEILTAMHETDSNAE